METKQTKKDLKQIQNIEKLMRVVHADIAYHRQRNNQKLLDANIKALDRLAKQLNQLESS